MLMLIFGNCLKKKRQWSDAKYEKCVSSVKRSRRKR